jgi:hypothetical protein
MAVLDSECRVRGIDRLRVVDSSVFPTITNGNLNAPTIMVAEKAADLIKGVEPLPPANAPYYLDAEWENRQRPSVPPPIIVPARQKPSVGGGSDECQFAVELPHRRSGRVVRRHARERA